MGTIDIELTDVEPATTGRPAPTTGAANASLPSAPASESGLSSASTVTAADAGASQPPEAPVRCALESDVEFCDRLAKDCGAATAVDNCGVMRVATSCGVCAAPAVCGAADRSNVCAIGELETTEQTLVVVRHGESRSNVCSNTCGGPACCGRFACVDGCADCYCDAFANDLSDEGWMQVQAVLPEQLATLDFAWDRILVSPAWRTQVTIQAYLEQYDQHGEIVPELDEASVTTRCARASCAEPPWKPAPYSIVDFDAGVARLAPRPYNAAWDPEPTQNPRPQYDHVAAHREGEQVIADRAQQYIDAVFEQGASAVLAVTHHDLGGALLGRLTGQSGDYSLDHAAAYSVLKRERGAQHWTVEGLNLR
jgi:broad specificity phosphatase PhoE